MLSGPQTDLVTHFDALRTELAAEAGEVAPVTVGAYAGQLLSPHQLVEFVPALWVDIETASVDTLTEGDDVLGTGLTLELVLGAVNQAGPDAQYSDGLALASWALRALFSEPLPVSGRTLRPVGPVRFSRIASDEQLYAARIVADLDIDP